MSYVLVCYTMPSYIHWDYVEYSVVISEIIKALYFSTTQVLINFWSTTTAAISMTVTATTSTATHVSTLRYTLGFVSSLTSIDCCIIIHRLYGSYWMFCWGCHDRIRNNHHLFAYIALNIHRVIMLGD